METLFTPRSFLYMAPPLVTTKVITPEDRYVSANRRIPTLFVYLTCEAVAGEAFLLLHKLLRLYHFLRISCRRQDLRNQGVRIQCDWSNELLQLFRTLLRSLGRLL